MNNPLSAPWPEIAQTNWVLALILVMLFVFIIIIKVYEKQWKYLIATQEKNIKESKDSEEKSRKAEDLIREQDRQEHINKWNSMIKANDEERDRQFKLYLRLAEALEINALAAQRHADKLDMLLKIYRGENE